MTELATLLSHLTDPQRGPAVLATLVAVTGSSYRRPGARLLVTATGHRRGSISGGCLEEESLNYKLDPQPLSLRCNSCGHVLLIVDEPGRPKIEIWLIDWSVYETFREFVERSRRGTTGTLTVPM